MTPKIRSMTFTEDVNEREYSTGFTHWFFFFRGVRQVLPDFRRESSIIYELSHYSLTLLYGHWKKREKSIVQNENIYTDTCMYKKDFNYNNEYKNVHIYDVIIRENNKLFFIFYYATIRYLSKEVTVFIFFWILRK